MDDTSQLPRVTINLLRGCLVATIQLDLDRVVLGQFRKDLLARLASAGVKQVILDCSGIEVLDAEDFDALRRTVAMASLMGARSVLAGLQPGVVSALIDLDVDLDGLHAALSVDDAFRQLEAPTEVTEPPPDTGGEEEEPDGPPQ
jgi:rsbT antagonist protein RsbS